MVTSTATRWCRWPRKGLHRRKEGRSTPYVINDKSCATGDWTDAMPWLEYEWLPQTVANGLKAMAYVVSADMYTYMAGFDFYQRMREVLPLRLFSTVEEARAWLVDLAAGEGEFFKVEFLMLMLS